MNTKYTDGLREITDYERVAYPTTGKQLKKVIKVDGKLYMIKYRYIDKSGGNIEYNHVSEYLSCKIAKQLGYDVQEVELVIFEGEIVVMIEMFKEIIIPFIGLGTSTLDGKRLVYNLDLLHTNFRNGKLQEGTEEDFWLVFLLDHFISNTDRHPNNWGFHKTDGVYRLTPLYDLGNSLYAHRALRGGPTDREVRDTMSAVMYKGRSRKFNAILREVPTIYKEEFSRRLENLDLHIISDTSIYFLEEVNYFMWLFRHLQKRKEIYK